jgi:hypothetical protein
VAGRPAAGGPARGVTYDGLGALALPEALLSTFPDEFREGMAARAERLGDRGTSAPEHWEPGLGTGEAHVLVTLYAVDEERLERARDELRGVGAAGPLTIVHEQRAAALEGSRDHFGFADGIAEPAVEGSGVAPRPGDGRPDGRGRWRPVRTGEFLHGYEDEDGLLPAAPAAPFDRNGTFMVYRKLHMDVAAFRRFVADVGRELPAARSCWPPSSSAAGPTARPRALTRDQRLLLRGRPGRPAVPARRPHPPRQPARRARLLRRPALQPPPHHPPRPALRPAAPARLDPRTTASTAGPSSSASTTASGARSRPSKRSGSTTATRSASAPTRTSSPASRTVRPAR